MSALPNVGDVITAGDIGEDQKEWIFEPISEPGAPEPVVVPEPSEPAREPVPA